MNSHELYQMLLNLTPPWKVVDVSAHLITTIREIVVRVEYPKGELLHCPECEAICPCYDHKHRRLRHLNTMQYKTTIESDIPRIECKEHGVRLIRVPWAEDKGRYTALF